MMGLTIGIRYLRGQAVATDPADRDRAEWPPHPARIFMALAAAHFDADRAPLERRVLLWLESQPAPQLVVPEHRERSVVTAYVPPNDFGLPKDVAKLKDKALKGALNILPDCRTSKQPRTFPSVFVGDEPLFCIWPEADLAHADREALAALCAKVTYLGHSSSLVQMWIAEDAPEPTLAPTDQDAELHLRSVSPGTLEYLESQYNEDAIERFAEFDERIRTSTGKEQRQAKAEYEEVFGEKWKNAARPPPSLRPSVSLTQGYRRAGASALSLVQSVFDDRLVVLTKYDGPALGLESTLALTRALRGAVMKSCPEQPPPEWLSGHTLEGRPSENPHLAFAPLAYVGAEHADGHVMGLAMVVPRHVSMAERGRGLSALLTQTDGDLAEIALQLGKLGAWTLAQEERSRPPKALRLETWTAASRIWASVTPIALDRFPKTDRDKDRQGWRAEVADIIAQSCLNIGLPAPVEIDIDKTSWHLGAPRARPDHGGYPLLYGRCGKPSRYQVHAWLRFAEPLCGPVLLGAGRYLGYGFCKPWSRTNGGTQQ